MRIAATLAVLAVALSAPAARAAPDDPMAAFAFYVWQRGTSETTVDRTPTAKRDLFAPIMELEINDTSYYWSLGFDWLAPEFFTLLPDSWYDREGLAKDEAFLNVKLGEWYDPGARTTFGYGFEFDTRMHSYMEVAGGGLKDKVRIGIGPNLCFRTGFPLLWTAPNVSLYYYPWPNEGYSFIPKGKSGWGYRVEVPVYFDVGKLFSKRIDFWLAAKPFYGWQSGFHRSDDSTGEKWNSEAKTSGVRVGFGFNW